MKLGVICATGRTHKNMFALVPGLHLKRPWINWIARNQSLPAIFRHVPNRCHLKGIKRPTIIAAVSTAREPSSEDPPQITTVPIDPVATHAAPLSNVRTKSGMATNNRKVWLSVHLMRVIPYDVPTCSLDLRGDTIEQIELELL
jgi:hypothetical protein